MASALILIEADNTFHQRWRDAEGIGNVVEPKARVVDRQQSRAVDVEREEIANGVGVLDTVEPVHQRPSRVGIHRGRTIQRRFEPVHEPVGHVSGRPGPPAGGIIPARSLITTFSQISAPTGTSETSR